MTAATTDTTTEDRQASRRAAEARRVAAVVAAFDDLGVTGVFGRVRDDLDGADELERALKDRRVAAERAERDLIDRLAAGARLDDVAVEFAGLVPGVDRLAEHAVAQRRLRAVRATAAEAPGAHQALVRVVDEAVDAAVEAGGKLVDVDHLARRLTPPPTPRHGWSYGGDVPSTSLSGGEHPWVRNPPVDLVDLDVTCAGDERLAVARIHARAATERVHRAVDVAAMLAQVGGPASSLWPAGRDRDQVSYVGMLPAEVQLAVAVALGWEPRLRATAARGVPPVDDGRDAAARSDAVRQAVQAAPLRRVVDRVAGLAGR